MSHKEPTMPAAKPPASASFASVKLPSALVQQAREAAQPQRRSVAGQIEYWATLGRIADETGLTVVEAREAIARYDARQGPTGNAEDESIEAIESRFIQAEATGQLADAVRDAVTGRRRGVQASYPNAA